jgi:NADH-quinone oxidoreductase subunit G
VGEARPAWKILRVLGNLLDLSGFEYLSSEQVRDELAGVCGADTAYTAPRYAGRHRVVIDAAAARIVDVPMYRIDALVRRATSLQNTREGRTPAVTY